MPTFGAPSRVRALIFAAFRATFSIFFGFERCFFHRNHSHYADAIYATPVERTGPRLRLVFAPRRLLNPLHRKKRKSSIQKRLWNRLAHRHGLNVNGFCGVHVDLEVSGPT